MKIKQVLAVILISTVTTLGVLFAWNRIYKPIAVQQTQNGKIPVNYVGLFEQNNIPPGQPIDFQQAAKTGVPAVAHITTVIGKSAASNNLPKRRNPFADIFGDDFFDDFFNGPQMRTIPQRASGSGVLISEDGYIVTNN